MRTFIVAGFAAIMIAVGTAVLLNEFVQETSAAAFTEPGVRIPR